MSLVAIHEEHTVSGAHRVREEPFPDWVPDGAVRAAEALSVDDARAALPGWLRLKLEGGTQRP
jgi:hypothetical protein